MIFKFGNLCLARLLFEALLFETFLFEAFWLKKTLFDQSMLQCWVALPTKK